MRKIFQNIFFRSFLVWLIFFLVFLGVHLTVKSFWANDDGYYHAKHAELMAETGDLALVRPWIVFHWLTFAPTDPWWGYHVIEAGYIKLFGTLAGAKALSATLSALVFAVFYHLAARLEVRRPLLWTILYFFSSSLMEFRLFLERPFILTMIVLPLAAWFLHKKKNLPLFLLALVYALLYNQSPLIIIITVMYLAAEWYVERVLDLWPLAAAAGGILAGIVLHPYPLNYVHVIFMHMWQVLALKFQGINLQIGSEVQTVSFFETLAFNFVAAVGFILACALFLSFKELREREKFATFLFFTSVAWFMVMLVVPRAEDIWLPFSWLLTTVLFSRFAQTPQFGLIKTYLRERFNFRLIGAILAISFVMILFNNLAQVAGLRYERQLLEPDHYMKGLADWFKENTPAGSVIFWDSWGYWPMMFYFNDHNRYLNGIDPTFFYEYDQNLYWLWRNIANQGLYCDRPGICPEITSERNLALIPAAIKTTFQSKYVLTRIGEQFPFYRLLNADHRHYAQVYSNAKFAIFEVK